MFDIRDLTRAKSVAFAWDVLRSPKTISILKLGAAIIGVIHAIDELRESPSVGKSKIGFRMQDDDQDES